MVQYLKISTPPCLKLPYVTRLSSQITLSLPSLSMLIHSASQLLTLAGGPQRGRDLGHLAIIEDGALLVRDEKILEISTTSELRSAYPDEPTLDAGGKVVMPGFVDPHTHAVWAGDRAAEFELRLQGKSYLEILNAGGGILSTVRSTRTSSLEKMKKLFLIFSSRKST